LGLAVVIAPLAAGAADDEKELKIFKAAPAVGKLGDVSRGAVYRNAGDLMIAMGAPPAAVRDPANIERFGKMFATRMFMTDDIDWKKQMIVLVAAPRKAAGYTIDVTKVTVKDKTATVHWKEKEVAKGDVPTATATIPAKLVLVERFDGDIQFDPPLKEEKKDDKKDKDKDKEKAK
jgi:hypothetical protein